MKRWIAGTVAGLLIVLVGPIGVASAVDPGPAKPLATEEQPVPDGTGSGNQTDPHLSGSLLAFTSIVGTSSEVRYTDLADGSSGAVPNAGHRDSLPDVDGDHVVFRRIFTDSTTTTRPILVFDVSAPELGAREVAPAPGERRGFPSIGGTTVAFMQFVGASSVNSEVCVADVVAVAAPAVCLTSDGTLSNRDPHVSPDGGTVTWAKCASTGTGCDVYVAQRAADGTWPVVQLTDSAGEDILPETDGTVVTYASNAGGDYDIWFENVDGTNERMLALTDAPGSIETNPSIAGGAVLFERELPEATDADLYLYRLTTGDLFQVTETPADETLNAMSLTPTEELRVAWAQPDGLVPGHNDIHAVRAQLSANQPPVLQVPSAVTVDAVGPSGAPGTYAATATDSDGTVTVTCAPAAGSTFAIGTTTVTCTAVDDDGATATGSFPVTVRGAREQLARFLIALTGVSPTSSYAATITTIVNKLPDRSLTLACEPLRLISKVLQQQSGRLVPADRAAALIADATRIRAVLACR